MAVSAKGKVKRIYPYKNGCYIRIDYSGVKPKNGYFHLSINHGNYNSLYSLAMASAVKGYKLSIRNQNHINPSQHAEVVYMVVDF